LGAILRPIKAPEQERSPRAPHDAFDPCGEVIVKANRTRDGCLREDNHFGILSQHSINHFIEPVQHVLSFFPIPFLFLIYIRLDHSEAKRWFRVQRFRQANASPENRSEQ
jgi:hypothetical protein